MFFLSQDLVYVSGSVVSDMPLQQNQLNNAVLLLIHGGLLLRLVSVAKTVAVSEDHTSSNEIGSLLEVYTLKFGNVYTGRVVRYNYCSQ